MSGEDPGRLDHLAKNRLLEQLMTRFGTKVLRLAFTYVKDRVKAEDIAQEVFIRCYENIDQFRGEARIETWIYRITVNVCKDYLKSWHVRHVFFGSKREPLTLISDKTLEGTVISRVESQTLAEFVMRLPVKYREVIILFYYEDMAVDAIAELLEQPVGTIKTRLRRARLKLRQFYERSDLK